MNSKFFNLDVKDFLKSLIVTVFTVSLATLGQSLEAGVLPSLAMLKTAGLAGITAGIAYLVKNLVSNEDGQFLKK